jgi:AcrR family transcriptional regulator
MKPQSVLEERRQYGYWYGWSMAIKRGSARRAEILNGLVQHFLEHGFLNFSLDDLASELQCSKSTLYLVAPSKEQLITAVVREFFREATERVDRRAAATDDPVARIGTYLEAISEELAPATNRFFADLDTFGPAREIYARNTAIAARRVQELAGDAARPGHAVNASFIGAVTGVVMEAIQRGDIEAMTSLHDATAYRLLADLITAGVTGAPGRNLP